MDENAQIMRAPNRGIHNSIWIRMCLPAYLLYLVIPKLPNKRRDLLYASPHPPTAFPSDLVLFDLFSLKMPFCLAELLLTFFLLW